jgi:hypothetical protein
MGKLKEKLLNNLTPEEENEMFELSAFEYVEYMENYKHLYDDNGDPIPEDVLEQMAKEKELTEKEFMEFMGEFNHEDYIKNVHTTYETGAEFRGGIRVDSNWGDEDEIERINDSLKLKYTDDDVISAIKALNNEKWLIDGVMGILNDTWNRKNGIE